MSTENPQRITFWHCHIRTGPYAARHVARRRSHLCWCTLALSPSTILWVTGHQSGGKKIKTDKPYGIGGGMSVDIDASGRKSTGKGVYQFVDKYGANVDGYSPIYSPEEWSPTGDTYVGGTTGLLIWAVTLAGLLGGGALLVYNTSALAG
ncbi:hypothetical protein OsJ_26372 [Oryza sativa Japonica Group]|uniref:Photosystem II 10 kDa polypeptide, chloroplastic n=1 Tax=Oryza sativa subsp. japonica TaxID=39947 RepID=B9FZJ0_ORYSJ|nr:hypothetical protein OsJ_26372 [Oryza sativa Japonica Group]